MFRKKKNDKIKEEMLVWSLNMNFFLKKKKKKKKKKKRERERVRKVYVSKQAKHKCLA